MDLETQETANATQLLNILEKMLDKNSKKRRASNDKTLQPMPKPSIKGHKKWSWFMQQLKSWMRETKQELIKQVFQEGEKQQPQEETSLDPEKRLNSKETRMRKLLYISF